MLRVTVELTPEEARMYANAHDPEDRMGAWHEAERKVKDALLDALVDAGEITYERAVAAQRSR